MLWHFRRRNGTLQLTPYDTRIQAASPSCAVATFPPHNQRSPHLRSRTEPLRHGASRRPHRRRHPGFRAHRGRSHTSEELRHTFELLGLTDKAGIFETDDTHNLNQELCGRSRAARSRLGSDRLMLSYRSVVDDPLYRRPLSSLLPGVIGEFEVEDILANAA